MEKYYRVVGLEKLSKKTNHIIARVQYRKGHGYILDVRAVEIDDRGLVGYVYSPEYYNIYYDEVCLLESCKRRGAKAEERANVKAKEVVSEILKKYMDRVAVLSGVTPYIIGEVQWID